METSTAGLTFQQMLRSTSSTHWIWVVRFPALQGHWCSSRLLSIIRHIFIRPRQNRPGQFSFSSRFCHYPKWGTVRNLHFFVAAGLSDSLLANTSNYGIFYWVSIGRPRPGRKHTSAREKNCTYSTVFRALGTTTARRS